MAHRIRYLSVGKSNGFTLIELLVVIGIIAILAAILLPTLNSSFARAEEAKARTDVKRLASLWKQYWNEYGRWPIDGANLSRGQIACEEGVCAPATSTGIHMNASFVDMLTLRYFDSDPDNPKRIIFLRELGDEQVNDDGDYIDPWGNLYRVMFDMNFDHYVDRDGAAFPRVPGTVIVWSAGRDGQDEDAATAADNINSWDE